MNENINLSEILKGHEGETFYSPTFGNSKLCYIYDVLYFEGINATLSFDVNANGTYCKDGEICIFPSKEQRDWNKWIEEQNYKSSKTWSQYIKNNTIRPYAALINTKGYTIADTPIGDTPIEKSALALLKIYQLIEVGYGGYPTKEDYDKTNYERLWTVRIYKTDDNDFIFSAMPLDGECFKNNIAFHTKKQTNEFISYPENIQLLKDYFMINK